ncbi:TetR/AcrR family transcriptional regulator [Bacillus sp. 03113]|uniref:TetR/AcrR family transcriptional regulator n=1 Tax=Bacillus sp. 03113 TaxID=2578211 RepID=UPI001144CAD6|nr:TetR/AcrR family transcriptional regulator [Bacillus sp. 03113]
MAILTEEKIFNVAEAMIMEKGVKKITLSEIAKALGVTHAAFYKHYKNKEDLLQQLALRWLNTTSEDLLVWEAPTNLDGESALHDWLWLLSNTKKNLHHNDKRMFLLYTDYLEGTQTLVNSHLKQLAEKIEAISGRKGEGQAILTAFVYFHNPYFADRWDQDNYQELFEKVWHLICKDSTN